jgi:hypothetical protein
MKEVPVNAFEASEGDRPSFQMRTSSTSVKKLLVGGVTLEFT